MQPNSSSPSRKTASYQGHPPGLVKHHHGQSIHEMAVLFTNVAGSTNSFESHGDLADRQMLEQHQDIVSAAVSKHGGVVVKILQAWAVAYFLNAEKAVRSAISIQQELGNYNRKKNQNSQIHVKIGIHFGDGVVENDDISGTVVNTAAKLMPVVEVNQIYISQQVYDLVNGLSEAGFEPVDISGKKDAPQGLTVYRTTWDEAAGTDSAAGRAFGKPAQGKDSEKAEQHSFAFYDVLTDGKNPPCFYCSDKRHRTTNCPSKGLPQKTTRALVQLGYFSFDTINKLLSEFVSGEGTDPKTDSDPKVDAVMSPRLAYHAYYDLKRVFQLRFFRNIWNSPEDSWDKISQSTITTEEKGGDIWIGTDSLRVSRLAQAEPSLEVCVQRHPTDYRPYCALGFLHVEKNDFTTAQYYFVKALLHARTRPQRAFVLFLLSRLYDLGGNSLEAAEKIREILRIDSRCPEAMYQDVVFRFKAGGDSDALGRLLKLIRLDRQFYVNALVDPDLSPFSEVIRPALKGLFDQAKTEAVQVSNRAENEFKKLQELFGENAVEEAVALRSSIKELSKTDGYFTYLDIIHYANSLINVIQRTLDVRKRELSEVLYESSSRAKRCLVFISKYPYRSLVGTPYKMLTLIETKISQTRKMSKSDDPKEFREAFDQPEEISAELDQVELQLKKLEAVQQAAISFRIFVKKCLIFQSANMFFAIVVFPVIVYYLNFVLLEHRMSTIDDIWSYQKGLLVLGGLCALLLAFARTMKAVNKNEG